ncbi:Aldo/keto reductase family protein [compost metagenome]
MAAEQGSTPTQVAIAWLLHKARAASTALIPILGSRTREQFDATLGALKVELSDEQFARLSAASAVELGVPHQQAAEMLPALSGGRDIRLPIVPVI